MVPAHLWALVAPYGLKPREAELPAARPSAQGQTPKD
jgi:hypothetical protein